MVLVSSLRPGPRIRTALAALLAGLVLAGVSAAAELDIPEKKDAPIKRAEPLPAVLAKDAPDGIADLKAMERQVRKVLEKVLPCTVGVEVGGASGSGVIVSEDGYVLTAGHVSGKPGQNVTLILHDGKRVKGKSLGNNRLIDSGMIKITDEGKWPFVDMGNSADLKKGEWVITAGHPGGYKPGRSPVVRLGRVLTRSASLVQTDCTLVGGDSGGPLFDMQARVVGIHSRIGGTITANIHVPVDTYRENWDKLAKGETVGSFFSSRSDATPFMGVQLDPDAKDCKISAVQPDSPAEKAGVKDGDVVVGFESAKITSVEDLSTQIQKKKPGDKVKIKVQRDKKTLELELTLGKKDN
jgi:serine protease Do